MDYAAKYAKERLTGRGYFLETGDTSEVDLGDVQMINVDFGIKRKEHWSARRGVLNNDRNDAYGSMGKWSLELDEFVTSNLAMLWGGTANADVTQSSATGSTFMFTSKKGKAFNIGKVGLFSASLSTPSSKTEGSDQGSGDYYIDRGAGRIYIPLGSTIADATSCTVTYSAPALTFNSVTPLNKLNRNGTLEIHLEDDSGSGLGAGTDAVPPSRYIAVIPCIISVDSSGDFKPDDYRSAKLVVTATSPMTIKRLSA